MRTHPNPCRRASRVLALVWLAATLSLAACTARLPGAASGDPGEGHDDLPAATETTSTTSISETESYTGKDEVAAYVHEFGHLPPNFISKTKARKEGWNAEEGNLDDVCPGMSIGGSVYHNDDGALPEADGRVWTECDIGYQGGYRGPKRLVFSNDGLVYYTADHYQTFERLY